MLENNRFFAYTAQILCSKRKEITPTPHLTTPWEYKNFLEGHTKNGSVCEETTEVAA